MSSSSMPDSAQSLSSTQTLSVSNGSPSGKPRKGLNTTAILEAAQEGKSLSAVEALHLLGLMRDEELAALREAADAVRSRQVGDVVSYGHACSIYFTNFCEMAPALYPYPRLPGDAGGFVLSIDDIDAILERALSQGITQLALSGGGFWSALSIPGLEAPTALKAYARVLSYVRGVAPALELNGFSPDEIEFLSIVSDRSVSYVLELFQDLGLRQLGAAGIEILDDRLRYQISPKKATVQRWFEIVSVARKLNLPVLAKLEAGPLETALQRAAHLDRLRNFLQANREESPWRFESLVPQHWTHRPDKLTHPKSPRPLVASVDRLKLTAVSRLFLGELLPQQQVCWMPGGSHEAQEALQWGANSLGATNALDYLNFLAAGKQGVQEFQASDFHTLIAETGRQPVFLGEPVPVSPALGH